MRGVTFAYLGPESHATRFAKKGTESDVTLYNAKQGDAHLNLVAPTRFPEKINSLLISLDLADEIVLHPDAVDRHLGEIVVGAELFGKTRGYARGSDQVPLEQLRDLLSKTALGTLELTDEPDATLRERLYARAAATNEGDLVLPIDHAFPVKGVGNVILGLVRSGVVHVHDELQVFPTTETVQVRSIQVHDEDQKSAPGRSRVGIAAKGADIDHLKRGRILAPVGSLSVVEADQSIELTARLTPFCKWKPRKDTVLRLFHTLQDPVLRVDDVSIVDGHAAIKGRLETPMARVPGQPLVLVDIDNPQQRFVGTASFEE